MIKKRNGEKILNFVYKEIGVFGNMYRNREKSERQGK